MDPEGQLYLHAYSLNYFCTNNTSQYDALICGMELAIQMNVHRLLVRGDSSIASGYWAITEIAQVLKNSVSQARRSPISTPNLISC